MILLEYIIAYKPYIVGIYFFVMYLFLLFKRRRTILFDDLPEGIAGTSGKYCFWSAFMCSAFVEVGIESAAATILVNPIVGWISVCIAV